MALFFLEYFYIEHIVAVIKLMKIFLLKKRKERKKETNLGFQINT
jgi:hypothetical protein